jgi:hypothetical protein
MTGDLTFTLQEFTKTGNSTAKDRSALRSW